MSVGDGIRADLARVETRAERGQLVEVRDPTAATQQVVYLGRNQPQVPEFNPETAIRVAYKESWVVARCVEIIARDVSALAFRAGLDPGQPANFDTGCALATMLGPPPKGPAPSVTARRWWWWNVCQRLVTGQMPNELELDETGRPIYVWPLTAARFQAIPSDGGSDFFKSYRYGRPDRMKDLSTDQVFYDWIPALDDYRQPYSPLQSARLDVSVSIMIGRYSYAFLRNGAVPATVVVTESFPNEQEKIRFQSQFASRYQGPDNAGKTAFMEAGEGEGKLSDSIFIQQIGMSAKDAKFLDQEKEALEHVAMALGVPWSKLSASGRTFDNAKAEDQTYWTQTLLPIITDLQDAVNLRLAPRVGSELGWFDLSTVEALRPAVRFTKVDPAMLVQADIVTPDEVRADLGLPPLADGMGDMPLSMGPMAPKAPPAPVGIPLAVAPAPAPMAAGAPDGEQRDTHEVQAERRATYWRATNVGVTQLERRWVREWRRMFARQSRSAVKALEGKRGHKMELRGPDANAIFNPDYWSGESAALAEGLYEAVVEAAGARLNAQWGMSFDLLNEGAPDKILARANQLAGQVTDTTYSAIQDTLAEGASLGESIPDLAARVSAVFDVASKSRATTIARTEVNSAYSASTAEFAALLPDDVAQGQEWIATLDQRCRDSHAEADGQAVAIGDAFSVGGEALMYPGDPAGDPSNVINCRCAIAIMTPDEYQAAIGEGRASGRVVSLRAARAALALVGRVPVAEIRHVLREVVA